MDEPEAPEASLPSPQPSEDLKATTLEKAVEPEVTEDNVVELASSEEPATDKDNEALPDPKEMERTMTLRQLRDLCTKKNLSSTGKKSELVARLHQQAS